MTAATLDEKTGFWADSKVAGLVGSAHFFSHFFMMALPPLFTLLIRDLGFSYTRLGTLLAISSVASGLLQIPMGVLVDRIGPKRVLIAGISLQSCGILVSGLAPGYWVLAFGALLIGIGNSVYHPADYAVLSARIGSARIGRAYSTHTFTGYIGWAAAPLVLIPLASLFSWRVALLVGGCAGLAMAGMLILNHTLLETPGHNAARAPGTGSIRSLMTRPILLCWVFFVLSAMMVTGLNGFAIAALHAMSGFTVEAAGRALAGFTLGAATGVLVGGILADRTSRHDLVAMGGLGCAVVMLFVLGTGVSLPAAVFFLMLSAGFGNGLMLPSRDMIVRRSALPGTVGKTFAIVSSGLDIGGTLMPLLYGPIMDHGAPHWIFTCGAVLAALAGLTLLGSRPKP